MTAIQKRQPSTGGFNPLASLPAPMLPLTAKFVSFFVDLIKDQTGLVARLNYWADEEGMLPEDAAAAFKALMKPAGSAGLEYGGQLLAALGAAVDRAIADRKAAERRVKRRQDDEAMAASRRASPPQKIADILASRRGQGG